MLVLTRKPGETICISRDIILKVVRLEGNRVRLGIDAPIEMSIVRPKVIRAAPDVDDSDSTTCGERPLVPMGIS